MAHFFIHNSFHSGDVILTRAVIQAVRISFSGPKITLECAEVSTYLWQDLDLAIALYQGSEYQGTEPTPNCPPEAIFVNMWFGVFDDILKLYGMTYQNNVHTFNRQMYQQHLNHKYLLPIPIYTPMITFFGQPEKEIEVRDNSILVENGEVFSNQNYFYLNEHLKQIASDFPQLNFYCSAQPKLTASNIIDCSGMNLKELSQVGDKCIGLLMKGSAINAACQTEINRYKPRCIVGWDLPEKLWDNWENPVVYAKNYGELKAFLSSLGVAENTALPDSVIFTPSLRKPRGLFLNTVQANCSIYESGKMAYQCLLLSGKYDIEYLEISPTAAEIPNNYEFYIFNYHHVTMSWLNTKKVRLLPGLKTTLVLETLTNNPFVLCPAEDFDAYLAIDPTMNVADKRVYAFPRPLETPSLVTPYRESPIPVIGSFGFATIGKGFELVVDAVNKEFEEAIVRINIPPSTYGDDHYWKIHKRNYGEYLSELCNKVAKRGVQVVITNEFLTKDQLIEWCSQNTLNCFLYNRNMPGLSATTDQAISSGRPLAISANETFRHIQRYIKPYPFQSLKDAIASSVPQVKQMQKDWHPQKFATKFEEVLEDFGMLPKAERKAVEIKVAESPKATILIVSHKQKQCGIYQYGVNITEALQKSSRYSFAYAECANYAELKDAVSQTNPAAIIYNYYLATMPWLTKEITKQFQIPQLGIMHEVTQEEADKATPELFDYHLCPDPTLVKNNPLVFKTKRLISPYINSQNMPDVVTIGSFGFGFSDKGFERLVSLVQQEFERAKIVLHLPFNNVVEQQGQFAKATAENCRKLISKPGIQLVINHEFLSKEQLLNFLASNTLNAFFYDSHKDRGISSVLEHALAVQRPLAINKCGMYRHVFSANPSICIEDTSLTQIINNGIAPLVPFYNEWSEASFILDYEQILDKVLGQEQSRKSNLSQQSFKVGVPNVTSLNRILDDEARSQYQPVINQLFALVPEMMARKIPEANIQQAFILDTVQKMASKFAAPKILCVGSHEDSAAAALKKLGYHLEEIDPAINCDLNVYFHKPSTIKGSYDIIFSTSVIEHVQNDELFMVQIAELLAPGGTGILTCDYNDQYKPGDRIPSVDFRLYTQKDFRQRLFPLLKNCVFPDVPQWDCPNPDFIYEGCRYTFATFVFKKLDREAEIEAGNSNMTLNLPHNSEITSLYQRIIGRIPDADELVHWNVFLDAGCNLNEIEMSLLTSYEYEQKKVSPQKELIDLQKFKIYVMNNDLDVGVGIIRSKVYEPHITHIFEQLLKAGSTFLDIGANIGYYTLLAASLVGDVGQVLSFEPNFQNLQLLYSSILENKFQNIVVYPFAASDSHELLKIKSFGSNGFLEPPSSCQSNLQLVQSIRVDDLLQSVRQINLVKIDIEGYEPLAIAGMDKLLRNYRPIIISEYSPWHIQHRCQRNPEDYLKQLASYNYRLHIIDRSARITPIPDTASVINYWQSLNNDKIHLDIIAQPL